ncbi:hypothetical protein ES703_43260 [subsurface metagenome]
MRMPSAVRLGLGDLKKPDASGDGIFDFLAAAELLKAFVKSVDLLV